MSYIPGGAWPYHVERLEFTVSLATKIEPHAWTVKEACEALRISRVHLYQLEKRGQLRMVRIVGRVVLPVSEGQRLLAAVAAE